VSKFFAIRGLSSGGATPSSIATSTCFQRSVRRWTTCDAWFPIPGERVAPQRRVARRRRLASEGGLKVESAGRFSARSPARPLGAAPVWMLTWLGGRLGGPRIEENRKLMVESQRDFVPDPCKHDQDGTASKSGVENAHGVAANRRLVGSSPA
jgi:hypothetical protein